VITLEQHLRSQWRAQRWMRRAIRAGVRIEWQMLQRCWNHGCVP
jgi:hypothetical protein